MMIYSKAGRDFLEETRRHSAGKETTEAPVALLLYVRNQLRDRQRVLLAPWRRGQVHIGQGRICRTQINADGVARH